VVRIEGPNAITLVRTAPEANCWNGKALFRCDKTTRTYRRGSSKRDVCDFEKYVVRLGLKEFGNGGFNFRLRLLHLTELLGGFFGIHLLVYWLRKLMVEITEILLLTAIRILAYWSRVFLDPTSAMALPEVTFHGCGRGGCGNLSRWDLPPKWHQKGTKIATHHGELLWS
jgi:hypothetical protein